MSSRSVYVIWSHPLFHDSVHLLLEHPDIQFVGGNSDYRAALKEILSLRPDTILLEEVGEVEPNQVMKILKTCPWEVLVVLISLADNQVNLYHHEQKTVGQTDDLLQLVLR
jgi:chemotaxis response regulator CheB